MDSEYDHDQRYSISHKFNELVLYLETQDFKIKDNLNNNVYLHMGHFCDAVENSETLFWDVKIMKEYLLKLLIKYYSELLKCQNDSPEIRQLSLDYIRNNTPKIISYIDNLDIIKPRIDGYILFADFALIITNL
jgi:hypothetical protein